MTSGLRLPAVIPPDERRTHCPGLGSDRRQPSSRADNPPFTMMGEFRRLGCRRIAYATDLRLGAASLSVRLSELCHHPAGFGERVREVACVGSMSVLAPVRDYIHSLVHPSARCHAPTAARHYAFMAPRLIGGLSAVAGLPVYLALRGAPSAIEALALGWLITPILLVYDLSRTGQLQRAHLLCSLSLTGLVTVLAAWTGGILSFAAIWFALVPLEAALSASRRTVLAACTMVVVAACFLVILGACGLVNSERAPEAQRSVLAAGSQRVSVAFAQFQRGG
jgi:hypothetical protein